MFNAHSMYRYVNDVNNVIITALHNYNYYINETV